MTQFNILRMQLYKTSLLFSALDAALLKKELDALEGSIVGYRKLLVVLVPRNPTTREGILLVCVVLGTRLIDGRFEVEFSIVGSLDGWDEGR